MAVGILGISLTYLIDSLEHKKWQAKIEKEAHNSLEVLKSEIRGSFGCIKYIVMEEIVLELMSHPDKEEEIMSKHAERMKPWNITLSKNFSWKNESEVLVSFLKAVKENPSGKVLAVEKLDNKVKTLYMAYPAGKTNRILLAYVDPELMLNKECSPDLLSKYRINLYGMDLFGGRVRELLVSNGEIPERSKNSFFLNFPTTKHRHNLMLEIMPKEGAIPPSPNRFFIWTLGLGTTFSLASFLSILQKKNIRLEESKQVIEEDKRKLHELSIKDPLTDIFNRRHFEKLLRSEFRRAGRYHFPLSCIMLDIDHFKSFNDTYGHQFGDEVLKEVAGLLRNLTREVDVVARYGGEEFIVILPETDSKGALALAERIRSGLAGKQHACKGKELTITVSLGVSTMKPGSEDINEQKFVFQADQALYQAKGAGRNRVYHF